MVAAAKASTSSVSAQARSSIDKASEYFKNVKEEVLDFANKYRPQFLNNVDWHRYKDTTIYLMAKEGKFEYELNFKDYVLNFASAETLIATAGGAYAAFLIANEVAYWGSNNVDHYAYFIELIRDILKSGRLVPVSKEMRKQALCDYGDFFIYEGKDTLTKNEESGETEIIKAEEAYRKEKMSTEFVELNRKFWKHACFVTNTSISKFPYPFGVYGPVLDYKGAIDQIGGPAFSFLKQFESIKPYSSIIKKLGNNNDNYSVKYLSQRFNSHKRLSLDCADYRNVLEYVQFIMQNMKDEDVTKHCALMDDLFKILKKSDISRKDCFYSLLKQVYQRICDKDDDPTDSWRKIMVRIPEDSIELQYFNLLAIRDIQMLVFGHSRWNSVLIKAAK
jgi:hypothetical protein